MGNCCSVSSASTVEQLGTRHAPPALGVSNRVVYPPQNAGDVQVVVCSAKWAANADERTPAVVKLTTQHAFVALFDGLGDRGDSIAAFCRSCVYEVGIEYYTRGSRVTNYDGRVPPHPRAIVNAPA